MQPQGGGGLAASAVVVSSVQASFSFVSKATASAASDGGQKKYEAAIGTWQWRIAFVVGPPPRSSSSVMSPLSSLDVDVS